MLLDPSKITPDKASPLGTQYQLGICLLVFCRLNYEFRDSCMSRVRSIWNRPSLNLATLLLEYEISSAISLIPKKSNGLCRVCSQCFGLRLKNLKPNLAGVGGIDTAVRQLLCGVTFLHTQR